MDGIEVIIPNDKEEIYLNIISIIEKEFNVLFEHDQYKFINYVSVNDYICQTFNDKLKVKGQFIYDKVLDGANEFLIIPIAIKEYFVNKTPVEKTITNHKNIFDFCICKKINRDYEITHNGQVQQQLNRFYASTKGAYIYKQKKSKTTKEHMFKDSGVSIINVKPDLFPTDVNYNWYISKAREIIYKLKLNEIQLKIT